MRRDAYCTLSRSGALQTTSTDMLYPISTHATHPACLILRRNNKGRGRAATVCAKNDQGHNSETDADLMEEMKRVREEK
jgi:hypothetical protein